MTRLGHMESYLKPFIVERTAEKIKLVEKQDDKILEIKLTEIFKIASAKQQNNSWVPSCLGILHLRSSILTKSFKYIIILSDDLIYFDLERIEADWIPQLIYCDLDKECRLMVDKLKCKFVRITEYEIEYLFNQILLEFKILTEVHVLKTLDQISTSHLFVELNKKEPFKFIYGDYMGAIKPILKSKEGIGYGE